MSKPLETVTRTLPGFSTTPRWAVASVLDAVVSRDGSLVAFTTIHNRFVIAAAATGKQLSQTTLDGVQSGIQDTVVDGKAAFLAVTATSVYAWIGVAAPVRVGLPAGMVVHVRGHGAPMVGPGDGRQVSVLTGGGLVPFTPPSGNNVGAPSALMATTTGEVLWATWDHRVLTGTPAGTVTAQITLAAPAADASLSGWVGVEGSSVVTVWSTPGGLTLVTHSLSSGQVTGQQPVASTPAVLKTTSGGDFLMAGNTLIRTATGAVTVPDPAFVPAASLGATFYGSRGTQTALLDPATNAVTTVQPPTVTPIGITSKGLLITLTASHLQAYNPAPAGGRHR
ncbi:hypothetical protein ACIRCZ_19440 [Leifsonia sp. NPDC102414]|uniref:hypothetical protein n=1 Tax=Leifsonia sp. NPDC102414 TaxID=3364124 RepID=UPI0038230200